MNKKIEMRYKKSRAQTLGKALGTDHVNPGKFVLNK
jgi:hypothetical protein